MKMGMISIFIGSADELYADKMSWVSDEPMRCAEESVAPNAGKMQAREQLVEAQLQL